MAFTEGIDEIKAICSYSTDGEASNIYFFILFILPSG
jgi:hypothetical protein